MSEIYCKATKCLDNQVLSQTLSSLEDPSSQDLEGLISKILSDLGAPINQISQTTSNLPVPFGVDTSAWTSITLAVAQIWKKLACCYGLNGHILKVLNAASCALAIADVENSSCHKTKSVSIEGLDEPNITTLEPSMSAKENFSQQPEEDLCSNTGK